jgi:acetoin utilization deacetylase AcuC-like enzyme
MSTAYITHPVFKEHQNGAGHPERPERLDAINEKLQAQSWQNKLLRPPFETATEATLALCHPREHVTRIRDMAARGGGMIDGDTFTSPRSYEAAALAVGAACAAVDAVMKKQVDNAFCAFRPPGHHAETARAMGFCLFNNIAIAARHAQKTHGLERVAIVDWDVHHGNGTQEIFYADPSVFFASVHEWGIYPGTGRADEKGSGKGVGTTANYPLRAGLGGTEYEEVWNKIGQQIEPFHPQLILVSAGFDAHARDPLAHMKLESTDFATLMRQTLEWAKQWCDGRVICLLEGGYHLTGLSESAVAVIDVLQEKDA